MVTFPGNYGQKRGIWEADGLCSIHPSHGMMMGFSTEARPRNTRILWSFLPASFQCPQNAENLPRGSQLITTEDSAHVTLTFQMLDWSGALGTLQNYSNHVGYIEGG